MTVFNISLFLLGFSEWSPDARLNQQPGQGVDVKVCTGALAQVPRLVDCAYLLAIVVALYYFIAVQQDTGQTLRPASYIRGTTRKDVVASMTSKMTILDTIKAPADLRGVNEKDLQKVADELRSETISAVAVTGGHLGAGLGVVELTVALHYIFDTPNDRLIWDVGHQAYPHKILTGRRERIRTLRQGGGLSGFTKRAESEYDCFGAAHSSTSISAGLGMAVARDLRGEANNVVCVIGDGAMSAGMAYEALNNAGARNERLIVILNDNDMSIAPPVGALSTYLARISSSGTYLHLHDFGKQLAKHLPKAIEGALTRAVEHARGYVMGGTLFEELGFYYCGPIDGHNLDHLLPVLRNVRDAQIGPILVHVVTQKGKGYAPAETSADKYHGVVKFDVATGAQTKSKAGPPQYTKVFAE